MTKTTGRSQSADTLRASWKAPSFTAPSPKKQITTWSVLAQPDAVAHAGGDRDVAAHDAVAPEVAGGHVVEVHAAALAAADAGGAAAQLGHQRAGVGAAGERVAVVAVGAQEVVVRPQQAHGPHAHGLLPDIKMQEAADLSLHVELGAALLETPDQQHGPVQRESFVSGHDSFTRAETRSYTALVQGASMNAIRDPGAKTHVRGPSGGHGGCGPRASAGNARRTDRRRTARRPAPRCLPG